jgi:hypothetical protein
MIPWVERHWTKPNKLIWAAVVIAIYLSLALWLKYSYVDLRPKGQEVVLLIRPFERFGTSRIGVIARNWIPAIKFDDADSADNNNRSPMVVYENQRLLGPAHSVHADIAQIGMGRYSHWVGQGFVLSASDNTDPNLNGRAYWAALPY